MAPVTVRPATPADGETLLRLIDGLARYEKLSPPDAAARQRILADLARDEPPFWAVLAEVAGEAVGYALCADCYSTFAGRPKFFLEDLYVEPGARGTGAGFALFRECAREALRRGCSAMVWEVLDWNRPSIDFYERLGAVHQKMWLPYRMEAEVMRQLPGLKA